MDHQDIAAVTCLISGLAMLIVAAFLLDKTVGIAALAATGVLMIASGVWFGTRTP